jgi:hypothetical protein
VDGDNIGGGVTAQGDAALVRDDEDTKSCAVEIADGLRYSGQQMKVAPRFHVSAFGHFFV